MTTGSNPPQGFVRTLVHQGQRTLIESRCKYCGFILLGNADDLEAQEQLHRELCRISKRRAAAKASRPPTPLPPRSSRPDTPIKPETNKKR